MRYGAPLRLAVFCVLSLVVLIAARSRQYWDEPRSGVLALRVNAHSAADATAQSREMIDFLERRRLTDPGDADVDAKLAGLYLQRLRETGALTDFGLAQHAAEASLAIVPAVRNTEALTALELSEFAGHQFARARNHALELTRLDYTGTPYAMLGDDYAELGDYDRAGRAYAEMRRRNGNEDENVPTRMARFAQLHGDNAGAANDFTRALQLELSRNQPSPERIAWFSWQLGDTAFFSGDVGTAESRYRDALTADPHYFRAMASLGRVEAARGDYSAAIASYEEAIKLLPDPTFVGELGDVYLLAGRSDEARREYDLVDFIGHLSKLNGVMYNRQIAMFYADHDLKPREAYLAAKREYAVRQDILGADALAWTALKAGKIAEAERAIHATLRLGTQDPRLWYHAGMIARAAHHGDAARTYLTRALALNPEFDPFQAPRARAGLDQP